jgi:hypothetical protein
MDAFQTHESNPVLVVLTRSDADELMEEIVRLMQANGRPDGKVSEVPFPIERLRELWSRLRKA